MKKCLICGNNIDAFMSFGRMPIANGFLSPEQFGNEYFFELRVGFCPACAMVQLLEQPAREMMFHENYAYFSSISKRMADHFSDFAADIMRRFLPKAAIGRNQRCSDACPHASELMSPDEDIRRYNFSANVYHASMERPKCDAFVVEIGSNDGIMLRHFADAKIKHLGIEPSANVAQAARERGVNTISEFFDRQLADKIVAEYGQADAILAANVMCHIPYLHSVAEGVERLLKPGGVLVFQDPYLGDIIEKTSYDQIYDEHAFYFSLASISHLFAKHGMEVIDASAHNVHGGSMRFFVARKGARQKSEALSQLAAREESLGLRDPKTYQQFRRNVEASRDKLAAVLKSLKADGKRIVGYGATSKSTTVTSYCGITSDLVEFITDTTPKKQGKHSPGAHIPVKDYDAFCRNYPDVALLFAWNHADEIFAKEAAFKKAGGKWLVYVPEVKIIE